MSYFGDYQIDCVTTLFWTIWLYRWWELPFVKTKLCRISEIIRLIIVSVTTLFCKIGFTTSLILFFSLVSTPIEVKHTFFLSTNGILTSVDWESRDCRRGFIKDMVTLKTMLKGGFLLVVHSKSVSISDSLRAITGFAGFELVLSIRRSFASIVAIAKIIQSWACSV